MKLWIYLFFSMFGSVLESCELTGVCLLLPWLIKRKYGSLFKNYELFTEFNLIVLKL